MPIRRLLRYYCLVLVRRVTIGIVVVAAGAAIAATPAAAQVSLRPRVHVSGLSSPVAFVPDPTNPAVQFVVEQGGRVRVVSNGELQASDFLDLRSAITSGGERGLLGMVFAPDYATSRRFYVNFTDQSGNTVIARFRCPSTTPLLADAASRFDLQWPSGQRFIAQPYANHNAGNLAFGPDGYLYVGLGDGGSGNDPDNRAQNPAELLGKMLRIDVSVADSETNGYVVPSTNPFLQSGPADVLPEIWAFGLRNPWRYSFDPPSLGGTGALIIGDVGQGQWEEVDYEPAGRGGRNYGWRVREGMHNNITSPGAAYEPLVDPIHEYGHSVGQSITGGFVYRGGALPSTYRGRYFFADYVQGRVWSLTVSIDPATREATVLSVDEHTTELGGSAVLGNISSFGVDAGGELYIVNHTGGTIVQITSTAARPTPPANIRIIR